MNRYSHEQETEIVRDAMNLTSAILTEESELRRLRAERFRDCPPAPQKKTLPAPSPVRVKYPPKPRAAYSFGTSLKELFQQTKVRIIIAAAGIGLAFLFVLTLVAAFTYRSLFSLLFTFVFLLAYSAVAAFFIIAIIRFVNIKKQKNLILEQSPEYQRSVKEAEAEAAAKQKEAEEEHQRRQAEMDREYEAAKIEYETVTVPEYKKDAERWEQKQQKKIRAIEEDLEANRDLLNSLYETTLIISQSYRKLSTLEWLYEDMSSSDHDIRYATELYDRERQRDATINAGEKVRNSVDSLNHNMMSGFHAVYNAIEEGNDLQDETNSILAKTRRDMNLGNIALGLQNRKTNKMLGNTNKMLENLGKR